MQTDQIPGRPAERQPALRMALTGITKSFGETRALRGVDLTLVAGEVLGIAGPNGAGKSTLVRILAGEETRDGGDILVDGEPWSPGDVRDRVAVVHQEPQLWTNLTVAQNMMVGREPGDLAFPSLPPSDLEILRQLEIEQFADRPLVECRLAIRQRVEIARALALEARFFLFDEPNSALTEDESDLLFRSMHDLAARGRIVVLVTHRLAELVAHCARVVVIRDGLAAAELAGPALTEAAVARELVLGYQAVSGEPTGAPATTAAPVTGGEPVLMATDWTAAGLFRDVTLQVDPGRIVAVVGVEGSGARELVASAAGFQPATGTVTLAGGAGVEALTAHSAYLPADRRGMLFSNLSVGENLIMRLGAPDIASPGGFLMLRRSRELADRLIDRFRVRTPSEAAPLPALSGGNQQKVAIAASIACRPALLVLEEPTRGVDVGSKAEIYRILKDFAAEGNGVLVYCTEVPEVHELADTVIVVRAGRPPVTRRVADFPSLPALADAIAGFEDTVVTTEDLERTHAPARP